MSLYSFYRISKPSKEKVPQGEVESTYKRLRNRTFWGVTIAYCLFYVCRMTFSVVKQPIIDEGFLTPSQLGIVGWAMLFVYAFGKFVNGFLTDYCNIRKFMATGLFISAVINLVMGLLGFLHGWMGIASIVMLILFTILWGMNGWAQSMGSPPGVISLSRWYPLSTRGTYYSIFCATPYLGKALSLIVIGQLITIIGWQWGFVAAALAGLIGTAIILIFVSDTPESKGLPSIQELSGEAPKKSDKIPTKELQKLVIRHPGIWIIALSSAFVYITQYGLSNWGVLFLQKEKSFTLADSATIIGLSEAFGVAGTVFAGWLSDKVFKGDRVKPVILSGLICMIFLALFLFTGGGRILNIIYVSVFSLFIGALYCIVGGLMALDIVPRKATGAALGVVGISSYIAAGIQDIVSGLLIQGNTIESTATDGAMYDFTPVAIFWLSACFLAIVIPVLNWRSMKKKVIE